MKTLARLPLAFEANRGQTDGRVRYLSRGMGYTLFLTGTEAVVALGGPTPRPEGRVCLGGKARKRACTIAAHCVGARELRPALKDGSAPGGKARERACTTHGDGSRLEAASPMGQTRRLRRGAERRGAGSPLATSSLLHLRLVGADPHARIAGEAPLPGRSHYLRGSDPAKWRTNVPQYAKVRAQQVYPGIDAVYYGNREGRLEYDFEVAPGADPNRIRLAFSGARKVELAANGDLLLRTAAGTLRQHRPVAYQEINGQRRYVSARYRLQHRKSANPQSAIRNPQSVALKLGDHDPTLPLIIDPVLVYSTYMGGTGGETSRGVGTDAAGNLYIAGGTFSADFPVTPGALDTTINWTVDLFVARFDPTGSSLLYATYLGGTGDGSFDERLFDMAVQPSGAVTLVGDTYSADFPTANPVQGVYGNRGDAFISRLSPDGSSLEFSTFLGGAEYDGAESVALDAAGSVYVTGLTWSLNFPTLNPIQAARSGGTDGFVAKLNATGTALVYSTYLGGSDDTQNEAGRGIAVDAAGSAYVTGQTNATNFPTTPGAFDRTTNGDHDIFAAKLDPTGTALVYATYLGGSGLEAGRPKIDVDAAGQATLVGGTNSPDFPTANAIQPALAGSTDAFIARLSSDGSGLVFSTYLGGSGFEGGQSDLKIAPDGSIWVAGETRSTNFPTASPTQAANAGGQADAFVIQISPDGAALVFSTYLGGAGNDIAYAVAVDTVGNVCVSGETTSADFPTVNPYQATRRGPSDAFLVKYQVGPPPAPPAAPGNLTATAVSQTRIDLAWGDSSDNEQGFRVERWNGSAFAPIATVGANATSYSNTGLSAATTYLYRVVAFNPGGDSAPSNTAEATTLPNPPAAPSNLVATALSQTEIRLTWNENAANEDGIEVWRSTGGPFTLHAGLGPNQTSYLDQHLLPATLYLYQVRAVNAGGDSPFSNQAGATTLPNPPAAPSGLTAAAVSGTQINLAWADNSTNETEFVLEVSSDGGATFAFLAIRAANTTTYAHTGLAPEMTRHYRVKARNAGGDSAWSNVAFATTPQVPPTAPTNLTATALSASEIRLNWNEVSGEQGYRLERRQGNDPFALVTNVGANTTTYTDGGLQPNKVYVYRLLAFNQAGDSGWSNEASARTLRDRPRPPTNLTAAAISATQVDVAWVDDNEDEQGFLLERSENAGVSWSQVASLPANVTRGSDTSAQGGKNYQYRLKAWNDVGQSDPSNIASVSTPAAVALASLTVTPTAVRGRRNATGKVTLTGAAPSGGVSVTLSSSHAAATVPSSVTVPAGATEATFTVTTSRVRRNMRVALTATLAAVQKIATLTVRK